MKHRLLGLSLSLCLSSLALACSDDEAESADGGGGSGGGATDTVTTTTTIATISTGTAEAGSLEASWSILVQGELRDCFFAGASYVDLAIEDANGNVETVRASCDAVEGATEALDPGTYTVAPSLVSFDEATVFTAPAATLVVSPGARAPLPIQFDMPGAHLLATWTLFKDGVDATCADLGAHRVEILASSAGGFAYSNTFDCPLGKGTTEAFPLGTYEVVVSLLYEQDVVLLSSDFIDATLDEAGEMVELPNIEFNFVTPPPTLR